MVIIINEASCVPVFVVVMYAPVDTALPFALGLVICCIMACFIDAILYLFSPASGGGKQVASTQFVISLFDFFSNMLSSIIFTTINILSALLGGLLWGTALIALGSMLYLVYEEFPWVWTDLARSYNAFLGPFIQNTVVEVLKLANVVFRCIVPLWNGSIFFVSRLLNGYALPALIDEAPVIQGLGLAVFNLVKHLVFSFFNFIQPILSSCPETNGDLCFDVANRTLDLMTPMADVRQTVSHLVVLSKNICGYVGPVVDAATFPFMDINFASAVHNIANAVLYLLVSVSKVTYLRCTRHGGEEPLMCTPDLEPVFVFLASGVRSMGFFLNNWLNVLYVIVQGVLGWSQISCTGELIPTTMDPGPIRESIFGPNRTALVGLTGNLVAITDGSVVAYEGKGHLRLAAWPSTVNISHGIAAVTYGRSSDADVSRLSSATSGTSVALFGCICVHSPDSGMQIQCSVLPYGGLLANETGKVPVFFQQGSTVQSRLHCSEVDIVVQSVRWPATRFSSPSGGGAYSGTGNVDCVTSRTCNRVDATVWIIPRVGCDSESALCDCFPYCMAARLSGSQTAPVIFYSASQWRSKVFLIERDCNLHAVSSDFVGGVSGAVAADGVTSVQASVSGGLQFVGGSQETISCVDNLLVTTLVNRSLHPSYDTPTPAFLRNPLAPFVITGDTVLTSVHHGDGGYTVRVERLTGAAGHEFTLSAVSNNFPAAPPPSVPASLFLQYPKDHLTVPYSRLGTVAVSSRDFVFYAVNPAIEVFDAYLHYCRNNGDQIDQFGLIMVSSYSPIRVWRVDAYRRCGAQGCGTDLVKQVDIPDAFSDGTVQGTDLSYDCARSFNEAVTQLEYINEINIAITVKHSNVDATFVDYRTYWLHTRTMLLRGPGLSAQGPWEDDIPVTALSAYSLCPAMQILPEFGSMGAEVLLAGVFLAKMPIDTVLYLPGIINLWSKGVVCPLQSRGHSILQQCGANAFSLEDFFSSLQTATNLFWSSLTFLSAAVGDLGSTGFIENGLNGLARYGTGTIDLWTVRFQVLNLMKAGPSSILQAMPTTVISGASGVAQWAQGPLKVSASTLGWARFGYGSVAKIVVTIAQNVAMNKPVSSDGAWRIVVNTLDEMHDYYDSFVVDNMRQACAGLSLMLGISNPWAVFVYHQCLAANTVVDSGLSVVLSVFNLAPFAQCMCSGSSGRVFGDYARINCIPQASTTLRPVLLEMIQSSNRVTYSTTAAQALCQSMLSYTRMHLVDSMQPWFDSQEKSLDALAASVDYALFWMDPKAGDCLDFDHDPDVVVLMPYPSDYFQACGSTSICRSRCSGVFEAFDASLAAAQAPVSRSLVTVEAESLFFPALSIDAFTPMRVHAITQPSAGICQLVCGKAGDSCVAVAGVAGGLVMVQHYCVPQLVTSSVFRTVDSSLEWMVGASSEWWNDIVRLQFCDSEARYLVALLSTGDLYMSSATDTVLLTSLSLQTDDLMVPVLQISSLMTVYLKPYACVSINLLFRMVSGQITGQLMHRKLVINTLDFPNIALGQWKSMGASQFFPQLQGYAASQVSSTSFDSAGGAQFLLLPLLEGMAVSLWTLTWDAQDVTNGLVGSAVATLPTPPGVGGLLSSGQTLSQNCFIDGEGAYISFSGAPEYQSTAWLSQLRVSGVTAAAYKSQRVPVQVETIYKCDISSCLGCPDGETQRLCDAAQQCAVIKCIGTPVNMRRVLCQVGQVVADDARQSLALLHGTWVIFVDMFMTIMDLSLQKGLTGVTLTWPDDRFFGYICTIKDNNAHMISVLTSALNGVIQMGHSAVMFLQGGAHEIDSNFNALVTMPLTALTNLANQVALAPLYPLIVMQKIMMCRANGVLAIFDVTGYTVRVGDASMQDASARLVGQCLTQNFVSKNKNPTDAANSGSTARIISQVIQSSATALLPQLSFMGLTLETMMHAIDGKITYWMGVVYGLSDVLQSLDMAHCKLPDYFLNDTMFCACGDTQFVIPEVRRSEGLSGVGLWCTGTLTMLDASNQPFVVYNPFSYAELQSLAFRSDAYLACMSGKSYGSAGSTGDCHSLLPSTPQLETQGVSVLTVLTACRNNYMHKQWDRGAHILFNQTLFEKVVSNKVVYPSIPVSNQLLVSVGKCLADQATRSACLQYFIVKLDQSPETYWVYEDSAPGPSQTVDACEVFTGPADNSALTADQRSVFRACLDQFADSNCQLSASLWTPQSDNAVPVAQRHGVRLSGQASIQSIVQLKFAEANALVMAALAPLKDYNNNDVLTIFFSPEGDIMHQMMDCVFMGPYPRVDYWPVDTHRILSIPSWHRDSNGSSRQLDPRKCVTGGGSDKAPPYSCGSQARQAVIKYFFRDYLPRQQNATLKSVIGGLVSDLAAAWNSTSDYACLCAGGTRHAVSCCTQNSSAEGAGAWLPPSLATEYQSVPANHILRALTTQLQEFYRFALEEPLVWTKYLDAGTLEAYNWSKTSRAAVAVEEALFRSDTPRISYDSTEVNSPGLSTGLWHQCHGLLSQLFFTIPMQNTSSGQWVPQESPAGPVEGADGLAAFVRSAVRGAHAHSPIYRHYNVSYVPSDSRMCRPPVPSQSSFVANPTSRRVKVSSFSVSGTVLMNTSLWAGLPAFGVNAFPLHGCFCGWDGDGVLCRPPEVVCRSLPSLCPSFPGASASAIDLIKTSWSTTWPCPALLVGDHAGIMGVDETDAWLTGASRDVTVLGSDILRRGRGGLRVGNYETVGNLTGQWVSPADRVIDPSDVALPHCASDYARLSGAPLLDTSMFQAFVAGVFPVGQGVFEAGTTAYCLRYLVELGMLEAMAVVYESEALTDGQLNDFLIRLSEQRKATDVWRVRCESQISLLALCKNLDVYRPPVVRESRVSPCPFSVASRDSNDLYTTPGCLVHSSGFFYDPCNCPGFACGPAKPLFSTFVEACRIPFDPRNMTVDTPLGGWRVSPASALRQDFADDILSSADGIGNVPRSGSWHSSEGFMNATGLHCDMLTDWWPERETLPVGYHATTPCGSAETGYRSFDSAFAVERSTAGQYTVVKMVYQHDLTRDATRIDTHLGAGGVCRLSNLGMPFYQTNTMQVCTRQLLGDGTLDPAIPVQDAGGAGDKAYGPESCSADSADVPWYSMGTRQDSALHSVGTVPNMPDPLADTTYPAEDTFFGVGPKSRILQDLYAGGTGWGDGCSDYAIKECSTSADCPLNYNCLTSARVCMSDDFLSLQHCYRHDMCPEGFLCSGVGQCVQGYVVVLNALNDTMEVPVFSEQCDESTSNSYATDGSSPWEYVPDWLIGHGMCSNKNWYMYMVNYLALQSNGACTSPSCAVDARTATIGRNGTQWWPDASSEPKLFPVKPTLCDRDYEHMSGPTGAPMKGCSPKSTLLENQLTDAFSDPAALSFAGLFRNYDNRKTSLRQMPFVSLNKTGFLGYPQAALTSGGSSTNILNCEKYQNCYAFPFTFNGMEKSPRLIRKTIASPAIPYIDDDIFRCGVSAYYDSGEAKCRLDLLVLPLYTSLCKTPSVFQACACSTPVNDGVGCKPTVNSQKVHSICENILEEFPAGYAAIQANTKYLQELFGVFIPSDGSLASQVSGVECFEAIYSNMQSMRTYGQAPAAGVYYPFSFALYEMPLAWVYQCVRVSGLSVDPSSARIRCQQFEQGKSLDKALLYPEGLGSFSFSVVKGGYRRADVVQSIKQFYQYFLSAWPALTSIPEFASQCGILEQSLSQCRMVPYCATTQKWIPNLQMDSNTRTFLAGMYQDVCGATAKDYALKISGLNFADFITQNTRMFDYSIQKDRVSNADLSEIEDIIKSAITSCTDLKYDETSRWPLTFSFDSAFGDCVDFVTVLNQLAMKLVQRNYMYSNPDQAYMPNQNIASQTLVSLKVPDGMAKPPSECIFRDLNDQRHYYDPDASNQPCPFVNRFCASTECKDYPLVFSTGEQGCRYPMQNNYTSLSSLVQYVWLQMRGRFNETLNALPKFTPTPPVALPFFNDSNTYFSGWSYDITGVQRYMSNINPDTSKELMCVLSSAKDAVNFTTCNDGNYEALSSFAQAFRSQGAAKVPPASQLRWKVSQAFLGRGGLFAFANSTRDDAKVLLRNLFNKDTRCGINEDMFNRVCLVQLVGAAGTSVKPWVPWLSGEWNPYEFCDVRLLELNQGNQEVIWPYDLTACPDCSSPTGPYRKSYMLDSQSPTCDFRQLSYARAVNVDPAAPTNLCYIRMRNEDRQCTHAQGMVGGERGQSVLNHPAVPHLYGTTNLSGGQHSAGIFPRSPRTLLSGRVAAEGQYGFLSVPGDELGVTSVGLSIEQQTGEAPYLRVARLPLQPEQGFMQHWKTQQVSNGWVQNLGDAFSAEDQLHAFEQQARGSSAWDCPMRRAAFYSQSIGQSFVPALPNPGRSRRVFGNLTLGRSAHPTFVVGRDGSALGYYTTSNGFCFCPSNMSSNQPQCMIPLSNVVHNCSLKRTIDALKGLWVQSYAFPPASASGGDSTCRMQFDWPYTGGTLRDGTTYSGAYTYSSDPLKRQCHVVDRLKPFLYRYKPGQSLQKDPGSTIDQGGVCHTGRAATITAEATARLTTTRCVKQSETDSSIDVSCEDGTSLTLSKERSTPLDRMVAAVANGRSRCDACAAPPTFTDSKHHPIQPESSFGIPFRFSASRAAALDLRQMICGSDTAKCDALLNQTAWTSENFMRTLLTAPRTLFTGGQPTQDNPSPSSVSDPAWDQDWVFCNSTDDLKSGQCSGRIPERSWRADRFQSCYKTVRDLTRDSPDTMSSVDVCLTDSSLQALCLAVQQAQTLVRQANCLASGSSECMLKPFMYLPSAWDVSNQAFVHQTVRRFYSRVTPYACPLTVDAVKANNQAIGNRCAAKPVGAMYLGLQACRDIVDALAQVVFYLANILMNGFLMMFAQDKSVLMAQIVYYWGSLVAVIQDLLTALSDIVFDMLFHMGSMGQRIYNLLRSACGVANKAYQYWLEVWCGLIIDLAPMLLGALRQVSEYSEVASEVLNDALGVIFRFMAPEALSAIEGLGYTKHFRDKRAADMSREKQVVHDTLVESKREGKSIDDVSTNIKKSRTSRFSASSGGGVYQEALQGALLGVGMNVLSGAGVTGEAVSFLMDIGNGIFQATELKRMYDLYPDNWTLFDFQSVYTALDTFEYFISTNDQCLAYRASGVLEIFNCSFPPLASKDSLAGAMLVATRCWADAQRDVGTSNLLACTESDTCYKSLYDTTSIVCAACPDAGEGYSLYGCSPVTKMCTCSVPTTKPSSCTSNEQCQYASTTCLLVTGLDFMSYGNQPCVECTKQVQCLIRDDSGVGQCGCVFQVQPIQQCTHPPGQMVEITSPNKVCGYLPNADRTRSVAVSHWDAIALTQCLYLSPASVYCVQVYQDTGVISMAVGLTMASMTSSYQSRRLLSVGNVLPDGQFEIHRAESEYALPDSPAMHALLLEDWNGTAAPCSALAWVYQQNARSPGKQATQLGPLDTMALHQCAYWRQVGRETIRLYGLSSLGKADGFLLSTDDFAAALSQKSVLIELIRNPEAMMFAAGHMPMLKPVYASLLTLRSMALSLSLSMNSTRWHNLPIHDMWHRAWHDIRAINDDLDLEAIEEWAEQGIQEATGEDLGEAASPDQPTHAGRRLLQTENIQFAESWLTGPFTWPPTYYTNLLHQECNMGTAIVQILHNILEVLIKFYYNSYPPPPTPPITLWANLPDLTPAPSDTLHGAGPDAVPNEGWIANTYHYVWTFTGINIAYVRSFFGNAKGQTNVFTVSTSMLKCDFSAVTYCTHHKKDLVMSLVLLGLLYMIVAFLSRLVGLPILATLLIFASVPIILWYCYGMAMTCGPMLPTCLIDDIIRALDSFFPSQVTVPAELSVVDDCLNKPEIKKCFKSCGDAPLLFNGWRDTLAFGVCYLDVSSCRKLAGLIGSRDGLSDSLLSRADAVEAAGESLLGAMRFCFAVTFVNLIPVIVLVTLILTSAVYFLYLPCVILPRFLTLALQSLAYTHARE